MVTMFIITLSMQLMLAFFLSGLRLVLAMVEKICHFNEFQYILEITCSLVVKFVFA